MTNFLLLLSIGLLLVWAQEPSHSEQPAAPDRAQPRHRVKHPIPTAIAEQYDLHPHYRKLLDLRGFVIVGSAAVPDAALQEAAYLIERMLAERPQVLDQLVASGTRLAILGCRESTTTLPEYADMFPAAYWNVRARGFGPTPSRNLVSTGEEDLLAYPGAPCGSESILVHEFAHAIHTMALRPNHEEFQARLESVHARALSSGRWQSTYAATNPAEYWAEGVQSWFGTNRAPDHDHNHVDTREELQEYDPALSALIAEYLGEGAWRYRAPRDRTGQAHLANYDPAHLPRFEHDPQDRAFYEAYRERQREWERRDAEDELDWLMRRAEAEDAEAMLTLGFRYRDGLGVEADDATALDWYRQAAERGHPAGQDSYAWMLAQGRGASPDPKLAEYWYRKSARCGHAQAQYNLGLMLAHREHAPQMEEARRWLKEAAQRGHRGAPEALQRLY